MSEGQVFRRAASIVTLLALNGALLVQCVVCGPEVKATAEHDCCKQSSPTHCGTPRTAPSDHKAPCPHRPPSLENAETTQAYKSIPSGTAAAVAVIPDAAVQIVPVSLPDSPELLAAFQSPPNLYLRDLSLRI